VYQREVLNSQLNSHSLTELISLLCCEKHVRLRSVVVVTVGSNFLHCFIQWNHKGWGTRLNHSTPVSFHLETGIFGFTIFGTWHYDMGFGVVTITLVDFHVLWKVIISSKLYYALIDRLKVGPLGKVQIPNNAWQIVYNSNQGYVLLLWIIN